MTPYEFIIFYWEARERVRDSVPKEHLQLLSVKSDHTITTTFQINQIPELMGFWVSPSEYFQKSTKIAIFTL